MISVVILLTFLHCPHPCNRVLLNLLSYDAYYKHFGYIVLRVLVLEITVMQADKYTV